MKASLDKAVEVLRTGGVALLPTDTVYGLAVLPTSDRGIDRLFTLKGRPRDRNLPVMIADVTQLLGLGVEISEAARKLITSRYFPGPITVVFGFSVRERATWLDGRQEVAVRIPGDSVMLAVLRATGPLLVTSANPYGAATLQTVDLILPSLTGLPDVVIDDGPRHTIPSTLVNCRLSPPVVEREGAVCLSEIQEIIECRRWDS